MSSPARNTILLELHVPDFEPVKMYYAKLGFVIMRETKPEEKKGYLVLKMEENILCFWAGNEQVYEHSFFQRFPRDTRRGYGVEIVIMVTDVEAYYQRVRDLVEVVSPIDERFWGQKDFRLEDPFGYYLRVTSSYNVLSGS